MQTSSRRRFLAGVAGAGAAAVSGCLGPLQDDGGSSDPVAPLPMVQYDAGNTGYHPDAVGPTGSLSLDRTARFGVQNAFFSGQPALVDGTAYVSVPVWGGEGPSAILAVDVEEGSEQWRFETESSVDATPAVGAERAFVSADGALRALDRESGEEQWSYSLPASGGNPTLVDDTVYVVDSSPGLHAVDAASGDEVWSVSGQDYAWRPTPAVVGDRVIVGVSELGVDSRGGAVLGFDRSSGEQQWRRALPAQVSTPVAADGAVYVLDDEGALAGLDVATGERRWRTAAVDGRTIDSTGTSAPALADGRLYAAGSAGVLACVTTSGAEQWRTQLPHSPSGAPVVADGIVYVSGGIGASASDSGEPEAVLAGVTVDGELEVEFRTVGAWGQPAVVDGAAYVGGVLFQRPRYSGLLAIE